MKGSTTGMTAAGVILAVFSVAAMIVIFSVCSGEGLAIGLICTGLFMVVGILLIICEQLSKSRRKNVIATGVKTEGIITGIDLDTSVFVNGKNPYKAVCEVTDPETGEVYLYSSEPVFRDIDYLLGQKVDVYYSKNDRSRYFVNLDSALNRAENSGIHDYR